MALKQLKCETIHLMDGHKLGVGFDQLIRIITHDLEDRPEVDKPRKITVQLSFLPVVGRNGLDAVQVSAKLDHDLPDMASPEPTKMQVKTVDGELELSFNPEAPEEPGQMTVQDIIEKQS